MRRLYQGFGWGLVLLGTAHMATTFRAFDTLSGAAIWFFGADIAMALTGALNLLRWRASPLQFTRDPLDGPIRDC